MYVNALIDSVQVNALRYISVQYRVKNEKNSGSRD